jgi:hypothetical protein
VDCRLPHLLCPRQAADPAQAWIILVVGALISFLGVPAGLIGNELSIRYGLRTIATLVFVSSFAPPDAAAEASTARRRPTRGPTGASLTGCSASWPPATW